MFPMSLMCARTCAQSACVLLQPLSTGLPWFYTSIIVGALFSRPLPARVLHQAALQLFCAHTAMTICPDLVELPPGPGIQRWGQARKPTMLHSSISMFLKSLMPLVHVPIMLGMLFGMPVLSLLSSSIGAASRSFQISRFRTQHPMQHYILHTVYCISM